MGKIIQARNKGVTFKTTWNAIGLPIGKDSETMMSYWGTSIRKNVPITIPSWKKVPQHLLDALFEDVVTKEGQIRDKPPEIYNFIKLKDLKDFVKSRLTKEWEEKSKAARKSAEANLYPQKKARRGYAHPTRANNVIYETSISRGQMWKLLRTDKEGNVAKEAKTVANRIDYFSNLCEKGKVEDTGREDVLYKALGKKEHGGRVTAVGVGVTISDYFGKLQSKKEYMDQVTKLMSRMNYLERELKKMGRWE
ncbi:putative alginate O-acetylase AlgJ [Bienertia sinuspersici]